MNSSRGVLWRHAGFMRLWFAQAISTFGAKIVREAWPIAAVLSVGARPTEIGILAALSMGPTMMVGLFAGGVVDRSRKRLVMIGSDLVRAAVVLTIPLAFAMHALGMLHLYVAAVVVGGASALFDMADHAYLPALINRDLLVEGNAKLGVTESIAEIGGPALNGVLIQALTAPFVIGLNALTYAVSAILLSLIKAPEQTSPEEASRNGWYRDLGQSLSIAVGNRYVRPLFLMAAISPLFGSFFSALYTIFALRLLGLSPALLGVTIAMGGVGALFGSVLAPYSTRVLGVGWTIVLGAFLSAVSALLIPFADGPIAVRVGMLMASQVAGDALAIMVIVPAVSLRQSIIERRMLGRVAGLFQVGGGASAIIGALIGGSLGDSIGVRQTLFVAVAGYFLTPLVAWLSPLTMIKEIPRGERQSG